MDSDAETPAQVEAGRGRSGRGGDDLDDDFTLLHLPDLAVPFKLSWARGAVYPGRVGVRKELRLADLIK